MKITKIRLFQTDLPYVDPQGYAWGAGNVIHVAKATVVEVSTDAGITGVGEFTPCGENYMVAHSEGVLAAARLMADKLIGEDPRQVRRMERLMDKIVDGHGYAKAPFDAAFWDIAGKAVGQPVWMMMGGKLCDGAPMYRVAPQEDPSLLAANLDRLRGWGYRQFQIKVGADWVTDIERIRQAVPHLKPGEKAMADANRGWRLDDALRVGRATRDLDYIMEQPCYTYEECLAVRKRIDLPMKLDEVVTDINMARRIVNDHAAEMCCLKISNLGGLSKARRVRDFLIDHGIPVISEDTWGGEVTTAALAHFAASTPAEMLINSTDLCNYNTRSTGTPKPPTADGKLYVSDAPGLGVDADYESLGEPIAVFG